MTSILNHCNVSDAINMQTISTTPKTTRDKVPVDSRETVSLQIVEDSSGFLLIIEESLINNSIIFELTEHQFASTNEKRATCITFILLWNVGIGILDCCQKIPKYH